MASMLSTVQRTQSSSALKFGIYCYMPEADSVEISSPPPLPFRVLFALVNSSGAKAAMCCPSLKRQSRTIISTSHVG